MGLNTFKISFSYVWWLGEEEVSHVIIFFFLLSFDGNNNSFFLLHQQICHFCSKKTRLKKTEPVYLHIHTQVSIS